MVKMFQTASVLIMAATALTAGVLWITHKQRNLLKLITVGIYVAILCLFIPHFYLQTEELGYTAISSIYGSLRVFLMEQDFEYVLVLAAENQQWDGQWYRYYTSFLFLIAPFLTFSNVLSLFRNAADRLRFVTRLSGTMYVLSELNPQGLIMAESIRKDMPHALIVFTDVSRKEAAGLIDRARELNAICISEDISHLRFWNGFQRKRIFLISEDEAENIAHGIALTQRYKNSWQKMAIYVYASMPGSNEAIDSLEKGSRILSKKFSQKLREITDESQTNFGEMQLEGNFSIRCIDPVKQTVLKLLQDNYLTVHRAAKAEKRISVTVLGFGNYGRNLLKTAAWIFQLYGYRVEFNVFDIDASVFGQFAQQAPELVENRTKEMDEDQHDIRFFAGIDCLSAEFNAVIGESDRERLGRTQLMLIALGDDSKNIAAAIQIRELFLRQKIAAEKEKIQLRKLQESEQKECFRILEKQMNQNPEQNELPLIYAVVTDEKRAVNLDPAPTTAPGTGLKASNKHAYNIRAIGAWSEVYAYSKIKEVMSSEQEAFSCHIGWSLQEYLQEKEKNDPNGYKKLEEQAKKYVDISYFRNSSVATRIHQELLRDITEEIPQLCTNDAPDVETVLNITEHMRWNAYMRGLGYCYSPVRNDRAKLHYDLVPYSKLGKNRQKIDSAVRKKEGQHV